MSQREHLFYHDENYIIAHNVNGTCYTSKYIIEVYQLNGERVDSLSLSFGGWKYYTNIYMALSPSGRYFCTISNQDFESPSEEIFDTLTIYEIIINKNKK